MIKIIKKSEPSSLTNHRCQSYSTFDNLPAEAKDELRQSLISEQGYLCCYCMTRISVENMHIEHWHCQSSYHDEQLDYSNLMASCSGNEGKKKQYQHCDARKGNHDLSYNPSNPDHDFVNLINYLGDGTIQSSNQEFDKELNEILNLNFAWLKRNRKSVLEGVHEILHRKAGAVTTSHLMRLIRVWREKDRDGKLKPYCGVAIYYLTKKLHKM